MRIKIIAVSSVIICLSLLMSTSIVIAETISGTPNRIVKFSSTNTLGDSLLLSETNNGIGLGIANPHARLDVVADAGGNAIQVRNAKNGIANIIDVDGAHNGRTRLRTAKGTETINILAQGISFFNGGNVGIGTKTPSALLEVAGLAKITKLQTNFLRLGEGQWINGHLSKVGRLDFGTIDPQSCVEKSLEISGALSGDVVSVGPSSAPGSTSLWSAYADTDAVTIRVCNIGTNSLLTNESDWKVSIWKSLSDQPVNVPAI